MNSVSAGMFDRSIDVSFGHRPTLTAVMAEHPFKSIDSISRALLNPISRSLVFLLRSICVNVALRSSSFSRLGNISMPSAEAAPSE